MKRDSLSVCSGGGFASRRGPPSHGFAGRTFPERGVAPSPEPGPSGFRHRAKSRKEHLRPSHPTPRKDGGGPSQADTLPALSPPGSEVQECPLSAHVGSLSLRGSGTRPARPLAISSACHWRSGSQHCRYNPMVTSQGMYPRSAPIRRVPQPGGGGKSCDGGSHLTAALNGRLRETAGKS